MTDNNPPKSAERDEDELLAEFDELLSDGSESGERDSEGGAGELISNQATEDASEGDLDELEAFLDKFEEDLDGGGAVGANEPSGAADPAGGQDFDDDALAVALTEPAAIDDQDDDGTAPGQAPVDSPSVLDDDDLDLAVDGTATAPAERNVDAAGEELVIEDDEPPVEPGGSDQAIPEAGAPFAGPVAAASKSDTPEPPAYITAAPSHEAAAEPSAGAGAGHWLGLIIGGLGLLTAGGAGWLAWEAQSELAALKERVGRSQQPAPITAEPVDLAAIRTRVAELNRRMEDVSTVAARPTDGLGETGRQQIAAMRAEMKTLSERLSGLDERIEALGVRQKTLGETLRTGNAPKAASPGGWVVNLASFADRAAANRELTRVRQMGISAEMTRARPDGRLWYRIRVGGFSSAESAKAYVRAEAAQAGYEKAWVGRR